MTTIISNGVTVTTPTVVLGWNSEQSSKTKIHEILGSATPDVTTRPALLRSGTLELLYASEADANTCRTMHTAAGTLTLSSTDLSHISMDYVVTGTVKVEMDDTYTQWLVSIGYQEV